MKRSILTAALLMFSFAIAPAQDAAPKTGPGGETKTNLSYGIVIDTSGSYRMIMEKVVRFIKDIVAENRDDDETFLVSFVSTEKIKLVQELTSTKEDLDDAIDNLYVQGGETAILDALHYSAKYLTKNVKGADSRRRVLVLITDGDERLSATKYDVLAKLLNDERISVFAVGIAERNEVSLKVLNKITKDTGGKLYTPRTSAEIAESIKALTTDIRKNGN